MRCNNRDSKKVSWATRREGNVHCRKNVIYQMRKKSSKLTQIATRGAGDRPDDYGP